ALAKQDALVVVGEKLDESWYKVVYRGATGYVPVESLSFSEKLEGGFGSGSVFGSGVRMLEGANEAARVTGIFEHGTEMQVLGVFGSWYKVKCGGQTGFIFSDYFALNGGVADAGLPAEAGQTIADAAMQYLDTPYVWAGASPSGFDCSGLVYYLFRQYGYTTGRTAADIYTNGSLVEKEQLQPGDAVCFTSSSNAVGHVGIYIGDGQFIHASSGSGRVIISALDESYYASRYVGARRLV
ncbi:MAG: C40 family peptidase, partial [Bacillota bacterium]